MKNVLFILLLIPLVSFGQTAKELKGEGMKLSYQGKYKESIEAFTRAIELDPNDAFIYYARGLQKEIIEDYLGAIADFNKAIEINPNDDKLFSSKGGVYGHLSYTNYSDGTPYRKNSRLAIEAYSRAIELNPIESKHFSERGGLYSLIDEFNKALSDFNKAIEIDENEWAYFLRANTYFILSDKNKACNEWRKIVSRKDFTQGIRNDANNSLSKYCN